MIENQTRKINGKKQDRNFACEKQREAQEFEVPSLSNMR